MCNDFGTIYRELGKFAEAKAYLNKGIAASNVPQYQGLNITLINTLASVYTKEGDKARSINLQKAALIKSRKIKNYIRELLTLKGLAETYGTGDVKQSLFYQKQVTELAQSKDDHREVIESLNKTADMYLYLKDYKAAYDIKQQQYAIADQFFYKAMSKQITGLQAAYELNQSKAKVQQLSFTNKQQKLERKALLTIMVGALIILIIGAFFYYKTSHLNGLLNKTNNRLQESNHVKDKLFSVLGHDLRSPFVSVINLLDFVDDEDVSPQQRKTLFDKLKETSNASLETLNNLLKWGEMQIKGVRLNQTQFTIKSIVDRNIAMLLDMANNKSLTIVNNIGQDDAVFADADHFDFVIRNFISNAIKFSFEGGTVIISANTSADGRQTITSVKDNGIGIPENQLHKIFNIANISTKGTNDEQGTSLGLLLCKEFIELNGGTIQVESKTGKGAAFSFSLNKAQAF
jgi:signal transduction histidine kinase